MDEVAKDHKENIIKIRTNRFTEKAFSTVGDSLDVVADRFLSDVTGKRGPEIRSFQAAMRQQSPLGSKNV